MSCSWCMRRLMEENMRRLRDQNEVVLDLLGRLRIRGWDADARFCQDGKIHVSIRRLKKSEV